MAEQGSQGLLSPFLRDSRNRAARPYLRGDVLDVGCGAGHVAELVGPERYVGFDQSASALELARQAHPKHLFTSRLPDQQSFDTIVALAVIEHVKQPQEFLKSLAKRLKPGGRIVLTTPHPSYRRFHDFGARLGIFSRDAAEEHETFLNTQDIERHSRDAGLRMAVSQRFLFGANQLFVLTRTET